MKTHKYLILVVVCLLFAGTAKSQQAPFYTQWMFNEYLINPAVAGTLNAFNIRANSRIQWMGITDAPRTMSVAGYGPIKKLPMGYGGYIYNDITGPDSRLALGGTYAYNIAINDAIRISGGINLGLIQFKLDNTQIDIGEGVDDPAFTGNVESSYALDGAFGIYMYSTYYFAGISAHQLFGNKLNTLHGEVEGVDEDKGINRLKQHFYAVGGVNIILNREFLLTPSALIKFMSPGQWQGEINVKTTYKKMIWGGLSYRTSDAISIIGGYNYENKIYIGLSYDITTSELRKYSSGTIEVMIGYRFNALR
jgi:type IX secretion system PorP/SprF family membrane protein